jgi:hypothetical protein
MKKIIIILVIIIAAVAVASYMRNDNAVAQINNFNECVAAGNPMLKSYPAQCKTKDGRTFVQDISGNTTTTPTNSAEGAPEGSLHNLPVPDAVKAAKVELATRLKIAENKIVVMSALEKEWSDGCLGLGGPAEGCLFAITPGYEVKMEANGKLYTYRTDMTGLSVRAEN